VEEVVSGKCIFAGGALIDDAFMNLLKAKVQEHCSASTFSNLSEIDFHNFAQACWEEDLKLNYSGDPRKWTFALSDA
jgi:hypothetical protein